jgi:hypothetical protein
MKCTRTDMYGCQSCYSVVQVWRYSVLMSLESVTDFFLITCVNNLFRVLFLFQNLSCCYILWYWQEATYIQAKYVHFRLRAAATKLASIAKNRWRPSCYWYRFFASTLACEVRNDPWVTWRNKILWPPIERNQKPLYGKHVFLLSSVPCSTVYCYFMIEKINEKRDVLVIFQS